jgi:pimeloyl-ACP methyl ester carboxylesterase
MRALVSARRLPLSLAIWVALVLAALAFSVVVANAWDDTAAAMRVGEVVAPGARTSPHPLVLTLGGPVYCGQSAALARYLGASLMCPDYGPNGERSGASRALRVEDWGDPKYLAAVARLPRQLMRTGVKVSKLVLVGASYAGYAAAELAATHPELRPRALIIVDSFLDLPARFLALRPGEPTRAEMIRVLGGPLARRTRMYERRSPSDHLVGLATEMRRGMRLLDVWSVSPLQAREFNGAMCAIRSNAFWMRRLAEILHRPTIGYVTELRHAVALWDWWRQLLPLAGLAPARGSLPATAITFRAEHPIPAASYCRNAFTTPSVVVALRLH